MTALILTTVTQPTFVSASCTDFSYRGAKLSSYGATMYPYFTVNGTTLRGSAWRHSAFPQYIDSILNMVAQGGMNTIRPLDFLQGSADPYDPTVWANMDYLMSQAATRQMFVILDLSSYRNMLESRGVFPYDPNQWTSFLSFVGARYADSPALLYYALAGEPAAPNGSEPLRPTMAQLTEFYRSASAQLRSADRGHHLISTGGLLFLDWDSGIDWQAIFSLPTIDVVAVHVYSSGDQVAMRNLSAWASAHGKPFVVEEFGFRQSLGDQQRAAAFQDLYSKSRAANAASIIFWNLSSEVVGPSHDVSPATPATWTVVQENAPSRASSAPTVTEILLNTAKSVLC